LQRAHVGAVGLIQENREFSEHGAGLRYTAPFLRIISRPVLDPDRKTVSPA
jgi:hypothetical protein